MIGLRLGVVAFLDVLGFKGIWGREQPRLVLDTMRRIKNKGKELQGFDHSGSIVSDDGFEHRVKCISDTVIVVVAPRGRDCTERMLYKAIFSATWIAGSIIAEALRGDIPLLFRGCLGAGLMRVEGDFLIGPAVDETAGLFEQADGPFFWLSPSAFALSDEYAATFHERVEPAVMIRHQVPLKDGKHIDTLAHSYFGVRCSPESWSQTRISIEKAFGPKPLPPKLSSKYANTNRFLARIEAIAQVENSIADLEFRQPYWDDLTRHQRFRLLKEGGMGVLKEYPRRSRKNDPA